MKALFALIKQLQSIVAESNHRYHNNSDSKMLSDSEYDIIKEFLEKIDPENIVLQDVGAPVKRNKANLPVHMPSMYKIKPDTKSLDSWLAKYNEPSEYVISAKLDGVSGLYVNKEETKLYTRGNGLGG